MPKQRPSAFDASITSFLVTQPSPAPQQPEVEVAEAVTELTPAVETPSKAAGRGRVEKPAKVETEAFRTSVYFHRVVHDRLRAIAYEERKSIMDLINEGLDHVLTKRHYPTTRQLRSKG